MKLYIPVPDTYIPFPDIYFMVLGCGYILIPDGYVKVSMNEIILHPKHVQVMQRSSYTGGV